MKTNATKKRGEERLDAQVAPGSSGGAVSTKDGGKKKRSPSEEVTNGEGE